MTTAQLTLKNPLWPYRLIPGRIGYELRGYARQGDTVFFTFLFPVLMYSLFAVIFSGEISPSTALGEPPVAGQPVISMATYYLPGLVAAGMLLSGLQNLAIDIAHDKHGGRLKLLAATPMSPITYLAGKLGQVLVTAVGQLVVLLAVARFGFGAELPTDPQLWLRFTWVFFGGLMASAMLGIALSAVPRSSRSASAVVIPIVLVLQFLSGVYIPNFQLPAAVQAVAGFFPLAWLAQGMRSVFLPDGFAAVESGGSWNLPAVALVMAAWLVAGALVARFTFRWVRRNA
jgi:ABC-2 type transport system permease protein